MEREVGWGVWILVLKQGSHGGLPYGVTPLLKLFWGHRERNLEKR